MKILKTIKSRFDKKYFVYFSLGLTSTGQVLAFVIGGHIISFFSIFLVLVISDLIRDRRENKTYGKLESLFKVWTYISIMATLFGAIYFIGNQNWNPSLLTYIPRILIFYCLFLLFKHNGDSNKKVLYIMKGILVGIIINCAWAVLDAGLFYATGDSITNTIFQAYIVAKEQRYGQLSLIQDVFIRSGGLNGDPANIGLFATILAAYGLYAKKKLYFWLSILSSMASVSFVGLCGIILVLFVFLIQVRKSSLIVSLLFALSVLYFVIIFLDTPLTNGLVDAFNWRMEMKTGAMDDVEDARIQYVIQFLPAVIENPIYFFMGTGYMTASYAYTTVGAVTSITGFADPENTYVSNYFDLGLIGFLAFLSLFYLLLKKTYRLHMVNKNSDTTFAYSCILGAMIAFMGYHYTLYSVIMLVVICCIIYRENHLISKDIY